MDYSDKYGFGYQLSDDSIGVSFNDGTKLILLPDLYGLLYLERGGKETYYTIDFFPSDLQKKVKFLDYIQQYMKENLLKVWFYTYTTFKFSKFHIAFLQLLKIPSFI